MQFPLQAGTHVQCSIGLKCTQFKSVQYKTSQPYRDGSGRLFCFSKYQCRWQLILFSCHADRPLLLWV